MADIQQQWVPRDGPGIGRKARLGGQYLAYVPEPLEESKFTFSTALSLRAANLERKLIQFRHNEAAVGVEGVFRFLMRSEAISSSRIEGLAPAADKVAIEELKDQNTANGGNRPAQLVARNVTILRQHVTALADKEFIEPDDIIALNTRLLALDSRAGFRAVQNWIGGDGSSPINADFVPPPANKVAGLMTDLLKYASGALHGGLIQAGIVHAQFETIHPFEDGNGRIGRALIQLILIRRGLLRSPSLPVSLVLGTWSDRYVRGLTAYREEGSGGVEEWLTVFFDAVEQAIVLSEEISTEVTSIKQRWIEEINTFREGRGKRKLRIDSTEYRLIDYLPAMPAVDAPFVAKALGVSGVAAGSALQALKSAGIVRKRSIGKRATAYVASDLIDVLTWADRRMASTQFDTAVSPPQGRAVPQPPSG